MIYKVLNGVCPDNFKGRLITTSQVSNYPTIGMSKNLVDWRDAYIFCDKSNVLWLKGDGGILKRAKFFLFVHRVDFHSLLMYHDLICLYCNSPVQGRLFSYGDTHRHRLGTNYQQLPVNCPYRAKATNYQRDGPQAYDNQGNLF